MTTRSQSIVVDIVGTNYSSNGRTCEEHKCCGSVLKEDMVVRFRVVEVEANGGEERAIAVYWLTGGIERCRVGFLPRYLVKHYAEYDGKIAQVTTLLRDEDDKEERAKSHKGGGVVKATLIDACPTVSIVEPPKKKTKKNSSNKSK